MKKEKAKKTVKKPKQGIRTIIFNNLRMYAKVARLTPEFFILTVIKGIIFGINSSVEAIFTVKLFDAIDRGAKFSEAAAIIGYMALFYAVYLTFNAFHRQFLHPMFQQKLRLKLHTELFRKAQKLDLSCYDDPEYYNDFVWAMDQSGGTAIDMMDDLATIITRLVSGSTLFTLLFSIDTGVAILLLFLSLWGIVIRQIGNKLSFAQSKESTPLWRVRSYINRVFHLQEYAKEIRVSEVTDLFMEKMDENTDDMIKVCKKYGKKFFLLYGIFDSLLGNVVYYAVIFYMFSKLIGGSILVGSFAAATGMIWRVRWQLTDLVSKFSNFPKHSLFLEKYYEFLSNEPKVVSGEHKAPRFESLELKNVSFKYDFSQNMRYKYHEDGHKPKAVSESKEALRNVSLKLLRGEKIAIVGYNGAGKTTLIKLLMRLYDPTEGELLLNGRDIKEYDLEEYRGTIGTVFQDFRIFAATIAENVINGDYNEGADRETVLAALDAAGFADKLNTLPGGVDTMLTREFDKKGTNLSGGEAQKVAIARVFAKPYELIIMDEPSSALDPMAEYELNKAILNYASDKTVIFISHRLSTTRMADRIYMFDSGELSEVGSHEELMALGGKYARMFNLQAEKYMEN